MRNSENSKEKHMKPRTNVKPDEWNQLIPVPDENWGFWNPKMQMWQHNSLGSCDVNQEHGQAHHFWQTPDHRAIAMCGDCNRERESKSQGKA